VIAVIITETKKFLLTIILKEIMQVTFYDNIKIPTMKKKNAATL